MLHTYNPPPMSLPFINFLHLTVSKTRPRQDFIGQGDYGKVKGQIKVTPWRGTHTPSNQCPHQVSTSYTLRSLRYSLDKILEVKLTTTRSNQCHTMALHTYTFEANVPTKYQLPTPYSCRDIAQARFYRSRSL